MENKNLLIAVLLSVGFMFFWSSVIMPRYAPRPAAVTATATATAPGNAAPGEASMVPAHMEKASTETILRDPQNEIVFSSNGGAIKHWRLTMKQQELDLVNNPDVQPLPLETSPGTSFAIHVRTAGAMLQGTLPSGLRVTKDIALSQTGYLHDLTFRFDNPTSHPIEVKDWQWGWGPGLGTAPTEHKENARLTRALSMGKLKAHVLKPGEYTEFGSWAAIDNRYFLVAFLPVSGTPPTLSVEGAKDQTLVKVHQSLTVPAHGSISLVYQMYVGPKGYTQLGKYNKHLQEAVDFGFFSPVGKVVLRAIYWLKELTGNYGWAIVLLTMCLQLMMFPLTVKSTKAQQAMKKLQPQIAELQKNYKSDPKRLNIEMMNLYKKSGTNPFGGCLPMVLQLPIFWALFTTLRNAYELRGAPFIFWIHDLSMADPYHVLPLVMGAAMFCQQRLSGAVTDPTQKQMMWMMPIMFTVMFFNFPAGLVLYWLTNNLVTMAIQFGLMRHNRKAPAFQLIK